jgi:hypothetical protein
MAQPAVSTQRPTDGKVLSHGIVATPQTGQARKCGWQGNGAGWRRGGGSRWCALAMSGGSGGQGSRACLGKLLQGGWVLRDLLRDKGGGWFGLAMDSKARGADKMQGRRGPFVPAWPEDGRGSKDGSTHGRGNGTVPRYVEAEHTRALQTTMRAPAIAASHEGHAERTLSVRRCPG